MDANSFCNGFPAAALLLDAGPADAPAVVGEDRAVVKILHVKSCCH